LPKRVAIDCAHSPDESLLVERAHLIEQDQPGFAAKPNGNSVKARAGYP
jgi:hypothetical protein